MKQEIQKLKKRIVDAFLNADNKSLTHDELEKEISSIEKDIELLEENVFEDDPEYNEICGNIKDFRKAIRRIKIDNFIYDEEIELDLMRPDKHDDNFNEDLISLEKNKIWDSIISSAKTKIDYSAFENLFSKKAEDMLLKIIVDFASDKSEIFICADIRSEFFTRGYDLNLDELKKIISNKDKKLRLEIFLTQLASSMLKNGSNPISVYNNIQQLLK